MGKIYAKKFQIFWTNNSKFIDLVCPQRYCHEKCNILAVNLNEKDIRSETKKSCFWHQLSSLCVEVIFIVVSVNLFNLSGRNSLGSAHRIVARKQKVPTSNNESYYNEIGSGNEKIAASTFRMGQLENLEFWESLTKRPPEDIRQLMRRIEEYKRLEDDWLQSKGKAPLVNQSRLGIFPSRLRRDLRIQEPEMQLGEINVAFKEPMHKIVDQIKNEPFFRWPNKMGGDPFRRNQNL